MANYSDPGINAQIKVETYAEEYCEVQYMDSDCVLAVDAVESEVLIDGRDMQNEESLGTRSIDAEHSEDERIDVRNPLTLKKRINNEKRNRHMPFIKEEAQFEDHHYTGKRKRRKYGEEIRSSQLIIEDAKTDSENNSFKCGICHRTFAQKSFLNRHLMIHTEENPYECEICHHRFNQKVNLHRHLRTHTGEKHFKCDICNFEFNQKVNLNRHILTHTGEKRFKCNICNAEFSQKGNLNRHLKTHTGEKPFKCDLCNFECNQKVNLQTHVLKHFKTHNRLEKLNDSELRDDMMIYVRNGEIYVAKLY